MAGQGRPRASRSQHAAADRLPAACWALAIALVAWWPAEPAGAQGEAPPKDDAPATATTTMRIRIAWGGGAERRWEGTIAVSRGTLSEPRPLGIEADEPGSMWLEDGRLAIRQRSARDNDGVDVLVTAPPDAKLLVNLTAADDARRGPPVAIPPIPLGDLSGEFINLPLDARENRLRVRRTPGDQLRVRVAGDSLVFSPGEKVRIEVQTHLLPVPDDTKIRLKAQLVSAAERRETWSSQGPEVQAGQAAGIPLVIPLPDREGVYDLNLEAVYASSWPRSVRSSLSWKRVIVGRKVQLLVVDPRRPAAAAPGGNLATVDEIDPVGPPWWEIKGKLPQLSRLTLLGKDRMGNDTLRSVPHPLGELAELKPNNASPDVSWEAYTLPVSQPGRPYVVEVEYPSDVPQTLGLSILEPNASGALARIGPDGGVDVEGQPWGGAPPRWLKQRLIFWPRTTAPLLLVSNRRERQPAVFGRIRLLAGWEHLPKAAVAASPPGRLLVAQLDRPLLAANFSAAEALDAWSGRSLDDWTTFHQGGLRLVEYLQHVGYNALMISVLADGSTIYPSGLLEPTPRYDTGIFFDTAADPLRKDVLEMLLRMFDREGLQLIPALEFASPLPELEAARRGPAADGIEWVGPDGSTWRQNYTARRGLAPYYNTLDPRVQEAMLGVVRELTRRYAHHRALSGLALRLSADGYAQLPGPEWGLDDATIARFERATGLRTPGAGPGRFAARAAFLTSDDHRGAWLQWRADELHRFYARVRQALAADCPDGRLYLAGAEMLCGAEIQAELRPVLPPKNTLVDSLLLAGIDPRQYQDDPNIVLLRSQRIVPGGRLNAQAIDLEINQMPDADGYFGGLPCPGSLFFHPPQEVRIPSFEQRSPFPAANTSLLMQSVPSSQGNRRRFVRSLSAMDSQVLIDGGWLLSMGQEESLAELVAIYRRLPAVHFAAVGESKVDGGTAQPVTFRSATCQGRTYLYAVNDAPFAVTAAVALEAAPGCRLEALADPRHAGTLGQEADGLRWSVELGPYDLAAAVLSQPAVKLSHPQVSIPPAVGAALAAHIQQLGRRAAALRTPLPVRVLDNPSFQRPATAADPVPGWAVSRRPGVTVQLDKTQRHAGGQSVRISSDGPVACLVSRRFDPPATGRLWMSVWLRVADAHRQPPLRLALQGQLDGRDYYRFAAIGQPQTPGRPGIPIAPAWRPFIFQVDDLPLEGLSPLHVRFDLMGPGEVWVDDVQLFDLAFNEPELRALYKLVTLADVNLQNGQIGDCMKLLDGYWPRFLVEHVPLAVEPPAGTIAAKPDEPPAVDNSADAPHTGLMDRMKNMLPRF
ncbi:MAG: family 10 glycosylhydrolase [Thermoguttaceae bacterium]